MKFAGLKYGLVVMLLAVFSLVQGQPVRDIDGNEYKTVTIGSQVWMQENLRATRFSNGDSIRTTPEGAPDICADTIPEYQWIYPGKERPVIPSGRLYSWFVVNDSRNVCPAGWHVPNDKDWRVLMDFLRDNLQMARPAGDTTRNPGLNLDIANQLGFKVEGSGQRFCCGTFMLSDGQDASWWSASSRDKLDFRSHAWSFGSLGLARKTFKEEWDGIPVRCLKDGE